MLCFYFNNKCVFPLNKRDIDVNELGEYEQLNYSNDAMSIYVSDDEMKIKLIVNGNTIIDHDGLSNCSMPGNQYNGKYFWITTSFGGDKMLLRLDVQTGAMKMIPYPFKGCLSLVGDEIYTFKVLQDREVPAWSLWKIDANMEATDLGEKNWDLLDAFNGQVLLCSNNEGNISIKDLKGNELISFYDDENTDDIDITHFGNYIIVNNRIYDTEYQ